MSSQTEHGITIAGGIIQLLLATMDPIAAAVFGIPSQALLAAGAGVFFGRTFLPSAGFRRTLIAWIGWTVASCYSLPLLLHFLGVPKGIVSSVAFIFGLGLQLLAPILVPVVIARSPAWLKAWADRIFGVKDGGQA